MESSTTMNEPTVGWLSHHVHQLTQQKCFRARNQFWLRSSLPPVIHPPTIRAEGKTFTALRHTYTDAFKRLHSMNQNPTWTAGQQTAIKLFTTWNLMKGPQSRNGQGSVMSSIIKLISTCNFTVLYLLFYNNKPKKRDFPRIPHKNPIGRASDCKLQQLQSL